MNKCRDTFYVTYKDGMYFRIFGYGLSFKKANNRIPLFSERYGYVKPVYIFGWRISLLRP